MITLYIKPRGRSIRKLPSSLDVDLDTTTTETLYTRLAAHCGLSVDRLRLTKGSDGSVINMKREDGKDVMVEEVGLREGSQVFVKDLGPQIGWRMTYIIEYLGPLLIHPLFLYNLRPYIYSSYNPLSYLPFAPSTADPLPPPTTAQSIACLLITLHFLKREYETLFVHRFSAATMPFRNIFKNTGHYWLLSGINLAYFLYGPTNSVAASYWPKALDPDHNPAVLYTAVVLWATFELLNFKTHLILKNLRPAGSTKRQIPQGWGFGTVTCPNYTYEIYAWAAIFVLSGGNWSVGVFIVVGTVQMILWAQKKERRYRKEFGSAYRRKKTVFPMLI